MAETLEHPLTPAPTGPLTRPPRIPVAPAREPDELAARRSLREQIARLEQELCALFCSVYPRKGFDWQVAGLGGGPRLLTLRELEQIRDDMVERLAAGRRALSDRTYVEEQYRALIEQMLLDPEKHKWERVANEDIGERGCKHWHVRPRLGIIGMLLGWWRVRISSGCPSTAPG